MAQRGRPVGSVQRPWTDALRIAAKEKTKDGKTTKLRRLAEVVFKAALEGDSAAAREIGDRLEGKPTQRTETLSLDSQDDQKPDFSQLTKEQREQLYGLLEAAKPKPAQVVRFKTVSGGQGTSSSST